MCVRDLGALGEEGVSIVEKEDGAAVLRLGEDSRKVFLHLAGVLRYHLRELDSAW